MVRLLALVALGSMGGFAQSNAALPHFEVASIKRNLSGNGPSSNDSNPAGMIYRNYTLRGIVRDAFGVDDLSLRAPDWMSEERFDISAGAPSGTMSDERRAMLRTLLMERFGLAVHRENGTRAGYALVKAKSGMKIQPVENVGGHVTDNEAGALQLQRTTMDEFAENLAHILRQPVNDETGVSGVFTFTLTYAPDPGTSAKGASDPRPSIFTAVEEQLGLRLEPRKIPTEILVVDHCEKMPTPN